MFDFLGNKEVRMQRFEWVMEVLGRKAFCSENAADKDDPDFEEVYHNINISDSLLKQIFLFCSNNRNEFEKYGEDK